VRPPTRWLQYALAVLKKIKGGAKKKEGEYGK
jgi:hypothetical protein